MSTQVNIQINDTTTPDDLDRYFTYIFSHRRKVNLSIDTTQSSNISLRRTMRLKSILNKHRSNSREFIEYSDIYVKNNFTRSILRTILYVKVKTPQS